MIRLRYFRKHLKLAFAKIGHHSFVELFLFFECINVPMESFRMNLDCRMVDVDLLETLWLCVTFVHEEMFLNWETGKK